MARRSRSSGCPPSKTLPAAPDDLGISRGRSSRYRTDGTQQPGDVLVDCTGTKSLLRESLLPNATAGAAEANTFKVRLEYALVITFLYSQAYDCNEYCKYYKNIDNAHYKFIPAVNRTYYDGQLTHVTGIVNISAEDYERMPSRFDGEWLRRNFPQVAQSMDRFIAKGHDGNQRRDRR